jgi:DNA recombination protein RmuC
MDGPLDPTLLALAALIIGLAGGFAAGWLIANRGASAWRQRFETRDTEARDLESKLLDAATGLSDARVELARLKANAESFDKQIEQMRLAREELVVQFKATGGELLSKAQERFFATAAEHFGHAEKTNKEAIATLLRPVGDKLEAYEKSVREMEADRKKDYGSISSLMDQVRVGQEAVKVEAASIVSSLRAGPKTSGRWGEQQFENLLELAGLSKFTDYRSEVSIQTGDGILRPDYVISLPGNRTLIVDIKCPLDAYLSANSELDPAARKKAFERFSLTVKGHAGALSRKGYWTQFAESPEFVILYIPGDNFLSAALEHDSKLWEDAARNRVIISGPATFFPLARTIAAMWDHEKLADKAQEVLELGRELHENLSIMTGRAKKLGQDLDKSVRTYNEFIKSMDGKVVLTARKFEDLNLTKSDKRIAELEPVEEQARPLMRLTAIADSTDEAVAE